MDKSIPAVEHTNSTQVNPNAQTGYSDKVRVSVPRDTQVNPKAVVPNGTQVNPRTANGADANGNASNGVLPTGTVVDGKYQIVSPMSSSGAEARLYVGVSVDTGEEFCIKLYKDGAHVRADVRDALLRIHHKNIADLHTWGSWGGVIYEVWTLYKGQNLRQFIAQKPLAEHQINGYLRQMNTALQVLHAAGLVHQDVKPANFMVMSDGTVVLIDFGVSASSDFEGRTHVTQIGRTTEYSSPEVLFTRFCWPASDYYSLGVTIYELLTGTTPYADYDESMAMRKLDDIRETNIPGIEKFSAKMQDLIKGVMFYEKDQRWGYEAVQAWLAGDYRKFKLKESVSKATSKQTLFKFGGKEFALPSEIGELVTRMAFEWDAGIRYLDENGRFVLLRERLADVDEERWLTCNEANRDVHMSYFTKLYKLYPQLKLFAWRGYTAENAQKLGEAILNAMWGKKIKQTLNDRPASLFDMQENPNYGELTYASLDEMVTKRILSQYLTFTKNTALAAKISEYEAAIIACGSQKPEADLWYYRIGYALSESASVRIGGNLYADRSAFARHVNEIVESCKNSNNNAAFVDFCKLIGETELDPGYVAWMESMGMEKEVKKLKNALKGR